MMRWGIRGDKFGAAEDYVVERCGKKKSMAVLHAKL